MSAPFGKNANDAAPPISRGGAGSCHPRWNASWAFRLLKLDDTPAIIQHYRSASAYWYKAYVASQASLASLAVQVEAVRAKLESIEAKLHGNEIHDLREALFESLPKDQPEKLAQAGGAFSPSTPAAMSGVLTPVEPIWLH